MAGSNTDRYLENSMQYASGQSMHKPAYPGTQPIQPAKRVAVVACMDARLDVEDLLGLQTGDAHIIRNAGGVVGDDAIRCLIISHHLLNTNEIILIHHTRCGMLAFTDDLLKAGLEGDPAAEKLLGQATGRAFTSCKKGASMPSAFHAFRGPIEPLDAPREAKQMERLAWDVRRALPYECYPELDFEIPTGKNADTYDRYLVRVAELRQSRRILLQCCDWLAANPTGDIRGKVPRVIKPPVGDVYASVESPKGELGFYLVSNGSNKPYRLRVRPPSFINLQALPEMARGHMVSDLVAIIGTIDIVLGEVDR